MRLGIGSYTYAWAVGVPGREPSKKMDAMALLDKAASMGVGVVQIADNLPLDRLAPAELDALAGRARQLGITIEVGTRGIKPEILRPYLAIARRLGANILRTVIDTVDFKPPAEEVPGLIRPHLAELAQSGVRLAIENHDRFESHVFERIIRDIGSPQVGICLDTANSFGALEGPTVVVDQLAPYVVNLHVKDFTIRRLDHMMGFVIDGAPAGRGRLDIPVLLDQLSAVGVDPSAILELWTPPEPAIEDTVAKEDAWAKQSVKYLRTLITD